MLQDLPNSPKQAQNELMLRIELGPPLIATKGYGASEVQGEYTRTRELWRRVGDNAQLCPILYGLWTFYTTRAEYETARTLCRDLLDAAESAHFHRVIDQVVVVESGI